MANDGSADVVIAGTGIVGCLIAEQALDAGLSVLMLEAGPRVDRWRRAKPARSATRVPLCAALPVRARELS